MDAHNIQLTEAQKVQVVVDSVPQERVAGKGVGRELTAGPRRVWQGIPRVKRPVSLWGFVRGETMGEQEWQERQGQQRGGEQVPECAGKTDLGDPRDPVLERGSGGPRVGVVYVDDLEEYPEGMIAPGARRCGRRWCHMWCDPGNEAALHALAARIGINRAWFQAKKGFPHYDLVPSKRALAIRHGAVPLKLKDWVRRNREVARC